MMADSIITQPFTSLFHQRQPEIISALKAKMERPEEPMTLNLSYCPAGKGIINGKLC